MTENICRVCGYDDVGEERWTVPDGAQYVICPCCGAEPGIEDYNLQAVHEYRAKRVKAGCPWLTWACDRIIGPLSSRPNTSPRRGASDAQ